MSTPDKRVNDYQFFRLHAKTQHTSVFITVLSILLGFGRPNAMGYASYTEQMKEKLC